MAFDARWDQSVGKLVIHAIIDGPVIRVVSKGYCQNEGKSTCLYNVMKSEFDPRSQGFEMARVYSCFDEVVGRLGYPHW